MITDQKIFETNFEAGSFIEKISGLPLTFGGATYPSLKMNTKGFAINNTFIGSGIGGGIPLKNFTPNNITILFSLKPLSLDKYSNTVYTIFDNISVGNTGIWVYLYQYNAVTHLVYRFSSGTSYDYTIPNINYNNRDIHIRLNVFNNVGQFFINGGQSISPLMSITVTTGSINCYLLGGPNSGNYIFNGLCYKIIVYQGAITQSEYSNQYNKFLTGQLINKPTYFPIQPQQKDNHSDDNGLIAAYNMIPSQGKLLNISTDNPANGNNARQYDASVYNLYSSGLRLVGTIKEGVITSNRTYQSYNFPNSPTLQFNNFTICLIYKASTTGNLYLGGGTGASSIQIYMGAVIYFRDNASNLAILSYLPPYNNTWNTIIITKANGLISLYANGLFVTSVNMTTYTYFEPIGLFTASTLRTIIGDIRFYNRVISNQEIKTYHNNFASKVVLEEDFTNYPVGASKLNTWVGGVPSTVVSIAEITTQRLVSYGNIIKLGTRYISGSSFTGLPSTTAYGTWSWFFKGTSNYSTGLYFDFITTARRGAVAATGYRIGFTAPVSSTAPFISMYLARFTLSGGNNTYIVNNITINIPQANWHNLVVKRYNNGLIVGILNGIQVFSYTDNTYTVSQYFLFYNALLTNLKITQGVPV
jgi:hypothetical protein